MPMSAPVMVRPEIETVLPLPTVLSANAPVAPFVSSVTSSRPMTPWSTAPPRLRVAVTPRS